MDMTIDSKADKWFKENVGILPNYGIRFKPMLYGTSPIRETYALAFETNQAVGPIDVKLMSDNNILYYVEDDDVWFFDGYDLHIGYDDELDEPKYYYIKENLRLIDNKV